MNLSMAVRPVVVNSWLMAIEHNIAGMTHLKSAQPEQAASVFTSRMLVSRNYRFRIHSQPVRLAGSFRCWFVKKYCRLVCVREKYCSGWKFTIVYDKPQPNEQTKALFG